MPIYRNTDTNELYISNTSTCLAALVQHNMDKKFYWQPNYDSSYYPMVVTDEELIQFANELEKRRGILK